MQQELKLTLCYTSVKFNDNFYFVICVVLCSLTIFPSASLMPCHSKIKHKGDLMPPDCVSENSDKNSGKMQSLCT